MQLNVDSIIRRSGDLFTTEVDGDIVMISVERGNYYGLDDVGSLIWRLLEHPTGVNALCDMLALEFEVKQDVCEREVLAFLGQMVEQGLIESIDVPTA